LEQLKNLSKTEHDSIYVRMNNVSKFAHRVFIVPDTDPSECLKGIIKESDNFKNSCYIRGNDMLDFPGKEFISQKIDILYVPYSKGISATQIRNKKLISNSIHNE